MQADREQVADELLVMDWQDGSAEALDQLVARWQRPLWAHAHRLTDDAEAAWEVVQEAWLGMIRGISRLEDPRRFRYWAFAVTTNKARDWVRRRMRRRNAPLEEQAEPVARGGNPSATVDAADRVAHLLEGLSVGHRAVVSLRYVEDFSINQIAATLGIPEGTVKSRLHYAVESLKRRMTS